MKICRLLASFLIILLSFNIAHSQVLNIPFPEKVSDVSFSHNGQYIAGSVTSSSKGETVFLWEVSGGLIKTLKESLINFTISCLNISPDDEYILFGGRVDIGRITMWELRYGNIRNFYTLPTLWPVNCLSFSPDGKYFVAGTSDKIIPIWSTEASKSIRTLKGHSKSVLTIVFDHDGKYLYSGSKDKKIIQWDFETGEIARTLIGHNSDVTTINISPDGNFLVSGSDDGVIYIWDLSTGNSIRTILAHEGPVTSVCFSPDGKYIISSSEDKTSKIFESSTGIFVRSYRHQDVINAVDISPDGKLIATASDDKSIKLWNSNLEIASVEKNPTERTTEPANVASVPDILWQVPFRVADTSTRKDYTMHAVIQSGSQLKSVSIYHNSLTREYDLTSYRANSSGGYNLTIEQNLSLDNGNNSIIIKAVNNAGPTTSEIRSVYYEIPVTIAGNEVVWETPSKENEITNSENFNVKVCIKSRTKIKQISLYLNNNLWAFERTGNIAQTSVDCTLKFEKEINLQKGNNEIKIEAINEDDSKVTASRNIVFQEYSVERRLALVIGNSKYAHGDFLLNPVNDALAMAKVLESVGFEVESYTDADQKTIKMAMDKFGDKLENYNVGLFYYAGHGVQVNGSNYIIPVDASLYIEQDVEYDCVEVGRILGKMEGSGCETNIIILDACRDNPFERRWSGRSLKTQGLAFMNAPSGSIIAYSTAPGKTASDGTGENGLYTGLLLKYIQIPGLQIEDVFKNIRSEIEKISDKKQTPWESTSLKGSFYFLQETNQPVFK